MTGSGDSPFDFAIFGGTPFATFLAGCLAAEHGKRVALIGPAWSPVRLPRQLDLSVSPFTRPETWALLKASTAETLKLLNRIGKNLFERVDPIFVAEHPASIARLGHVRHLAAGFGYAAERASDKALPPAGTAMRIRDAAALVRGRAEPALALWAESAGVVRLPSPESITVERDGSVRLGDIVAIQPLLVDDDAVLQHLPEGEREKLGLVLNGATLIATAPAKTMAAAAISYLDRGLHLAQRTAKGSGLFALATGSSADAAARLGSVLPQALPLRRLGQAVFRTVDTADGAPLVALPRAGRAGVVAGLGPVAPFLVPALARHLAGAASDSEAGYWAARDGTRRSRAGVAERETSTGAAAA